MHKSRRVISDSEEKRFIKLLENTIIRIQEEPIEFKYPEPREFGTLPFSQTRALLIQGLDSTSDETNISHFHLGPVLDLLAYLKIAYVIFSYLGTENLNYYPWHTVVNIAKKSKDISNFISSLNAKKIVIIAHSQGGCLVAHWVCNYATDKELKKIAAVFFGAAPLFLPFVPPSSLASPGDSAAKRGNLAACLDGYIFNIDLLADRLNEKMIVVRNWRDGLAPALRSSFLFPDISKDIAPCSEIVIRDAEHPKIYHHHQTISTLRSYIRNMAIN